MANKGELSYPQRAETAVTTVIPHRSGIDKVSPPNTGDIARFEVVDVMQSTWVAYPNGMGEAAGPVALKIKESPEQSGFATHCHLNGRGRVGVWWIRAKSGQSGPLNGRTLDDPTQPWRHITRVFVVIEGKRVRTSLELNTTLFGVPPTIRALVEGYILVVDLQFVSPSRIERHQVIAIFRNVQYAIKTNPGNILQIQHFNRNSGKFSTGFRRLSVQFLSIFEFAFEVFVADIAGAGRFCTQGAVLDVAESNSTVVALDKNGAKGYFFLIERATGWQWNFQILMYGYPIDDHVMQTGIFGFIALGVKTGCLKGNFHVLPQAGCFGRVGQGCFAHVDFARGTFPVAVDSAEVAELGRFYAPAIEQLYLIAPLQVDARVGTFGHHKVQFEFQVAVFPGGKDLVAFDGGPVLFFTSLIQDVVVFVGYIVEQDSFARCNLHAAIAIHHHIAHNLPIAARGFEIAHVFEWEGFEWEFLCPTRHNTQHGNSK